jgi:hypothetical protein
MGIVIGMSLGFDQLVSIGIVIGMSLGFDKMISNGIVIYGRLEIAMSISFHAPNTSREKVIQFILGKKYSI